MILAVGWDQVPKAVQGLPDWGGRIVIDATNQWHNGPGTEVDLGDETGSERNAALMPGARVVKAFNTLYARVTPAQDPAAAMAASSSFSPTTTRTPAGSLPADARSAGPAGARPVIPS